MKKLPTSVEFLTASFFAICVMANTLAADTIHLNDGSVLNGEITAIDSGKITIKTSFAGELKIDQTIVKDMESTTKFDVAKQDNTLLDAKSLEVKDGKLTDGSALGEVKYAWKPGDDDPRYPRRKLSLETSVDITDQSGNTDKTTIGLGGLIALTGPEDKVTLTGKYNQTEDNHKKTEDKSFLAADYELRIHESRHTLFLNEEFERDKIAGLDRQLKTGIGYGYYIFDSPTLTLRPRIALVYIDRKYDENSKSYSSTGAEAGFLFKKSLQDWGTFVTAFKFGTTFEDFNKYRYLHESYINIPLQTKLPLSLRLGVSNEFNSVVDRGKDHMDTEYFVKMIFTWK